MNQVQTVIATVNGPQMTTTGKQFWVLVDGQGTEYRIWEAAQAQKAMALSGQQVLLTYAEKQNGQYMNRSFKDAMPFAGASPMQPATQFTPSVSTVAAVPIAPPAISSGPSDRDAQIIRQSAYKAAVDLVSARINSGFVVQADLSTTMVEVRSVADELVAYGLTGSWGGAQTAAEPAPAPATANAAPWE